MSRRHKKSRTPRSAVERTPPPLPPLAPLPPWRWFLLSSALPLVLLASKLNLDLWEDEIYTVTKFVAKGPWHIVTDYSAPNNHVFYSLVLWPCYLLMGDSSFALRLPSLVFAAGTLGLVFRLSRRFAGLPAATSATVSLGLNQMFLVHAIQVRGYSLSMLLAAWLADLAIAEPKGPARRRLAAIVFAGAAFLYTLPTNALFFLPLAGVAIAWSALSPPPNKNPQSKMQSRRAGISLFAQNPKSKIAGETLAWLGAVMLAGVCYAPIYAQVLEHSPPKGVFSWSALWLPASTFFSTCGRDSLFLIPLWLAGIACWGWRILGQSSSGNFALPRSSAVVIAGAFVLTGLLRVSPFVRNYTPLLPSAALLAGWSFAELLEAIRRRWAGWLPSAVSAVAGLLITLALLAPGVATYPRRLAQQCAEGRPQDGYFNYYAADYRPSAVVEALAERARKDESYLIVFALEDHWNLVYYLKRAGLELYSGPLGGSAATAVYTIAPRAAHWDELAAKVQLPEEELRQWPLVADCGYYRLFRSPEAAEVELSDKK